MKTIIVGAGSDLGVHIDGAHIGPAQLSSDLQSFYKGDRISFVQDENILKSRNLSDRRKNEYDIDKFNTSVYKAIVENYKEEEYNNVDKQAEMPRKYEQLVLRLYAQNVITKSRYNELMDGCVIDE